MRIPRVQLGHCWRSQAGMPYAEDAAGLEETDLKAQCTDAAPCGEDVELLRSLAERVAAQYQW